MSRVPAFFSEELGVKDAMRGHKVGTQLKADEDKHKHHFTVNLKDDEMDDFFALCRENDEMMSVAIRKCIKIVCGMPKAERIKAWMKVSLR